MKLNNKLKIFGSRVLACAATIAVAHGAHAAGGTAAAEVAAEAIGPSADAVAFRGLLTSNKAIADQLGAGVVSALKLGSSSAQFALEAALAKNAALTASLQPIATQTHALAKDPAALKAYYAQVSQLGLNTPVGVSAGTLASASKSVAEAPVIDSQLSDYAHLGARALEKACDNAGITREECAPGVAAIDEVASTDAARAVGPDNHCSADWKEKATVRTLIKQAVALKGVKTFVAASARLYATAKSIYGNSKAYCHGYLSSIARRTRELAASGQHEACAIFLGTNEDDAANCGTLATAGAY